MDPSFVHLLETNAAPSDLDIAQLRSIISSHTPSLLRLDATIANLEQQLAEARKEHHILDAHIQTHRRLLSPIRRLPVDILRLIFEQCLPESHNAIMSTSQAPMLLTHVCHLWRDVALQSPRLWSSIHIPIPPCPQPTQAPPPVITLMSVNHTQSQHDSNSSDDEYVASFTNWILHLGRRTKVVETWLDRAGRSTGLSISLAICAGSSWPHSDSLTPMDPWPMEQLGPLINSLLSRSRQWESIVLAAPAHIVALFTAVQPEQLPMLNQFTVLRKSPVFNPMGTTAQPYASRGILHAPSLQSVTLQALNANLFAIGLRWENLVEFHFDGYTHHHIPNSNAPPFQELSSKDALEILRRCRRLRKCTMYFGSLLNTPPAPPSLSPPSHLDTIITMPSLQQLVVREGRQERLGTLFRWLHLPNLDNLAFISPLHRIGGAPDPAFLTQGEDTPSSLETLLDVQGHTIKSLQLNHESFTREELYRIVTKLPNVEHLSFTVGFLHGLPTIPAEREIHSIVAAGPGVRLENEMTITDEFMDALTPKVDAEGGFLGDVLLPRLRSFAYKMHIFEFSQAALLKFIAARRDRRITAMGVAPLQHVKVQFSAPEPPSRAFNPDALGYRQGRGTRPDVSSDETPKHAPRCCHKSESQKHWPALQSFTKEQPHVDLSGAVFEVFGPPMAPSPWVNMWGVVTCPFPGHENAPRDWDPTAWA